MRLIHEGTADSSSLMQRAGCLGQPYYTAIATMDADISLQTSGEFAGASVFYYVSISKFGPWVELSEHTDPTFENKEIQQVFIKANISGGVLEEDAEYASGYFEFADQPSDGGIVFIGGVRLVFVDTVTESNQVEIGSDVDETITNFADVLSGIEVLKAMTFTANTADDRVDITYNSKGTAGNSINLASFDDNVSPSDTSLTSGTDYTKINVDVTP